MNEAGYLPPEIDDESECTVCENCMIYCPDLAIVVEKESEATSDNEDSEAPRGPVETGSPLRSDKARGNRAKASKDE